MDTVRPSGIKAQVRPGREHSNDTWPVADQSRLTKDSLLIKVLDQISSSAITNQVYQRGDKRKKPESTLLIIDKGAPSSILPPNCFLDSCSKSPCRKEYKKEKRTERCVAMTKNHKMHYQTQRPDRATRHYFPLCFRKRCIKSIKRR